MSEGKKYKRRTFHPVSGGVKKCRKCTAVKLESEFNIDKYQLDGLKEICRDCHKAKNKKQRQANPEKTAQYLRKSRFKTKYGLTVDQFNLLSEKQSHKCAICDGKVKLVVDHCHTTGTIRGLLCKPCNGALGMVKENPFIIERLSDYCLSGGIL